MLSISAPTEFRSEYSAEPESSLNTEACPDTSLIFKLDHYQDSRWGWAQKAMPSYESFVDPHFSNGTIRMFSLVTGKLNLSFRFGRNAIAKGWTISPCTNGVQNFAIG
jgi:hypothetical protein